MIISEIHLSVTDGRKTVSFCVFESFLSYLCLGTAGLHDGEISVGLNERCFLFVVCSSFFPSLGRNFGDKKSERSFKGYEHYSAVS